MLGLMRALALLVGLSLTGPAAAESPTVPTPPKATATTATPCKKVVVGRGLDRKVVCEITVPMIVKAGAPKPEVLIVPRDARSVVGRPRSENRLNGISQRRN